MKNPLNTFFACLILITLGGLIAGKAYYDYLAFQKVKEEGQLTEAKIISKMYANSIYSITVLHNDKEYSFHTGSKEYYEYEKGDSIKSLYNIDTDKFVSTKAYKGKFYYGFFWAFLFLCGAIRLVILVIEIIVHFFKKSN